jgi:hypothetical protein
MKIFGLGYPANVVEIAKHDNTTAYLLEKVGQWSFLPPAFKALIVSACAANLSSEYLNNTLICISNKRFYGEAILAGSQISLGSSEVDGIPIPSLYMTESEVHEEIASEHQRYMEEIEDGDRDDDDEYEGYGVMVKWDGGDDIKFFELDSLVEIPTSNSSWKFHCGL